jgi:methylated-DNA-protein-cysteine methyltransferase-like protein
MSEEAPFFDRVYEVVQAIPAGRVASYGAVSRAISGRSSGARTVGWALNALRPDREDRVPWWRVINAQGRISNTGWSDAAEEQRARLEAEGIQFGPDGRVDMDCFGWP